ncbi:CAP domain-containing protein [uncultured Jatrophihabitans sp.]|uniref:CAP domain-containing protein n=1 Tax=uncultured Jatrophihabitans sp. TaxID=1610747 RepID=UPI0035CC7A2A
MTLSTISSRISPRTSPHTVAADNASVATVAPRRRRPVVLVALGLAVALLMPLFVSTASAEAQTSTERSYAISVLHLLNSERHAHHLGALRNDHHLVSSARSHNLAMARANTMSHQVRGESALGRRVDRAGYHWTWAGENIGYNGRISRSGVLALQRAMYNERAPYNGHRLNILNSHFKNVGIDVYIDRTHHKFWLTSDFGRK